MVKAGKVLAKIAAPGTRDADGQAVPTSMRVDGQDVVVTVAHHGRDVAYPLMVDPTMTVSEPDWYASNSSDFDGWVWVSGNTYAGARPVSSCYPVFACSYFFFGFPDFWDEPQRCVGVTACNGAWGRGLYTINNGYYAPAGEWAQWAFVAGNAGPEINVSRAELKDAWSNNGCSPAGCGIAHIQGLWRQTNWVSMWLTTSGYNYSQKAYCSPSTCDVPTTGQNAVAVVQQIATWTGGYFPSNFDFLASASLVISDNTGPNSLTATHTNQPTGWVNDANDTVTASAADGGVGVKEFDLVARKPDGSTQTLASAVNPCPGNRHGWCPSNWSASVAYNTQGLPEGDNTLTITAKDAWGNQTDSTPWHVYADHTAPELTVEGPLRDDAGRLVVGDQSLAIDVLDGTDDTKRAGVASIELKVDDQRKHYVPQACDSLSDAETCPLSVEDWLFHPGDYSNGEHTITALATDSAGNVATETWSVRVANGASLTLPCTLQGDPVNFATYSLGAVFEGLARQTIARVCETPPVDQVVHGLTRANSVTVTYGVCTPDVSTGSGSCVPPLQIQTWPACERNRASYGTDAGAQPPNREDLTIRGVPASIYDDGSVLEVYTGLVTVVIFSANDDRAKMIDAANSMLPTQPNPFLDPDPLFHTPDPTNLLSSPVAGALQGLLACTL